MGSVFFIEFLKSWLESKVSAKIKLKVPTLGAETNTYEYTLKNPIVLPFNYKNDESAAPSVNVPSIYFTIKNLYINNEKNEYIYTVEFIFGCWDLGNHSKDNFIKSKTNPQAYEQKMGNEFVYTQNGWADILNFTDIFVREIRFFDSPKYQIESKNFNVEIENDEEVTESGLRFASCELNFIEKRVIKNDETTEEKKENGRLEDFSIYL